MQILESEKLKNLRPIFKYVKFGARLKFGARPKFEARPILRPGKANGARPGFGVCRINRKF